MISFRTKDDQIAAGFMILGIVLLAASLVWMLLPLPSVAGLANGKARSKQTLEEQIKQTKAANKELSSQVDPLLWTGSPEDIGPKALSSVTTLAMNRHLKVSAFRPQKRIDMNGLLQVPFSASITGGFADAANFVKDLQNPKYRLAVSLVQLTATDGSSDAVTGTVNVVAYIKVDPTLNSTGKTIAK